MLLARVQVQAAMEAVVAMGINPNFVMIILLNFSSGTGGATANNVAVGAGYGSVFKPTDKGSSGASAQSTATPGGSGGGYVRIIVDEFLEINGTISSNGGNGVSGSAGGNRMSLL